MSNTFSKLKSVDENKNILHKLISLDEIINQKKHLTTKQKLNMSLDEIIQHKEIYDEEYVEQMKTELNDELKEYFQHKQLNDELKEYFEQKQLAKTNPKSNSKPQVEDDYEVIEWDYWGVTKTPKSLLDYYDTIPSSPIKLNQPSKPPNPPKPPKPPKAPKPSKPSQSSRSSRSSRSSKQKHKLKQHYKQYYKNKNLFILLKNYKSLNTLLEERIKSLLKSIEKLKKQNRYRNRKRKLKSKIKINGKKIYYKFISK